VARTTTGAHFRADALPWLLKANAAPPDYRCIHFPRHVTAQIGPPGVADTSARRRVPIRPFIDRAHRCDGDVLAGQRWVLARAPGARKHRDLSARRTCAGGGAPGGLVTVELLLELLGVTDVDRYVHRLRDELGHRRSRFVSRAVEWS
jgi:hypothetical protein